MENSVSCLYKLQYRIVIVEIHDDIDDVLKKIEAMQDNFIAIVVPRGAIIFQSIICLKILSFKVEKIHKKLFIVTQDKKGIEFADILKIENATHLEFLSKNKTHNVVCKQSSSIKNKNKSMVAPKKSAILMILFLSCFLFLFVISIVFSGVNIVVSPQKKSINTTINLILQSGKTINSTDAWNKNILLTEKLSFYIEEQINFATANEVFTGKNATGKLIVYNKLPDSVSLKPGTQFISKEGVSFRSKEWIKIQGASSFEVEVFADERDSSDRIIGERGNLKTGVQLKIPKLSDYYQKFIWAEVKSDITNGETQSYPIVLQEDLDLAKNKIIKIMKDKSKLNIEKYIERKNKLEDRDLVIINNDNFFNITIESIEFPEGILNKKIGEFSVYAKIKSEFFVFSKNDLKSIKRGALMKFTSPNMEIYSVDDNIDMEILSKDFKDNEIKATIQIIGTERYIVKPQTVNSIELINRMKESIKGIHKKEAKKILENMKEISDVRIELWPPFLLKIPDLPENINFELID